jgi:hypothetical protein
MKMVLVATGFIGLGISSTAGAEISLRCRGDSEVSFGGSLRRVTRQHQAYDRYLVVDTAEGIVSDRGSNVVAFNCTVGELDISCDSGMQEAKEGRWTTNWQQKLHIDRATGNLVADYFYSEVEIESQNGAFAFSRVITHATCAAAKIEPLF